MAIDVNINDVPEGDGYSLGFRVVQTTTTAADATVLTMRNNGTRKVRITDIDGMLFYSSSAATTLVKGYYMQRFTTATPSGGTSITPAQTSTTSPASSVAARFADTGLTTTNVVFGDILGYIVRDTGFANTIGFHFDWADHPVELLPGEGVAFRVANVTMEAGVGFAGAIHFIEA